MPNSKCGRPPTYTYIAELIWDGKTVYRREGTYQEIAEVFGYHKSALMRNVLEAEDFGDGVFRIPHAPGWEIKRMITGAKT